MHIDVQYNKIKRYSQFGSSILIIYIAFHKEAQ